MTHPVSEAVDLAVSGLEEAEESVILRRLDKELQQQTEAGALSATLGEDNPAPWVLGGEQAGGFGSMAQRFLAFYADAIHREICNADNSGLKDQYKTMMGGQGTKDQVKSLVPVILNALGVAASFVNPAAIAALVALWLIRTGLDQWCTVPRPAATSTTATTPTATNPPTS